MTNSHQYIGVCCFGRGRKFPTFKKPFLSYHLVPWKASSSTHHRQSGIKTPLSFLSHISSLSVNITKVDELPVSNLAPPQHLALPQRLALLPLSEDQPRMSSAGENVQGAWEPGSQRQNKLSLPRWWAPQLSQASEPCSASQEAGSAPSPPLHSWQGVFLLLFLLLLSWFQARCLLVLQPKINSRHSEGYSKYRNRALPRERNNLSQELLSCLLFPS